MDGAGRRASPTTGPADRAESTIDGAEQSIVPGWAGDDALTGARSDAELVASVREGDRHAFAALYERHAPAARAVARRYSNSAADAEDAVADGFARILAAVRAGHGPDAAFRAYLFTVVRRVALQRVDQGRRVEPTDDPATLEAGVVAAESSDEPTMAGFERDVVAQAYRSLPERWQAVLWYTEVEGLSPAQIAPALGIPANAVAVLAYRAREGLRQAYLQKHVAAPTGDGCARIAPKLGAYVRGTAAARDTAAVSAHLAGCTACSGLVLELGEVSHAMRTVIGPLVLGAAAVTAIQGIGFGGAAALGGSAVGAATAASIAGGLATAAPAGIGAAAPAGIAAAPVAAAPLAAAAGGTSVVAAGAVGTGTSLGVAAGATAGGGAVVGWSALAAGTSMGALKLGATGALVAAAVGVVPALGPLLPESVRQHASVSVLPPASGGPAALPGEPASGTSVDGAAGTTSDRPATDPAAVILPDIAASGVDGTPGVVSNVLPGTTPRGEPATSLGVAVSPGATASDGPGDGPGGGNGRGNGGGKAGTSDGGQGTGGGPSGTGPSGQGAPGADRSPGDGSSGGPAAPGPGTPGVGAGGQGAGSGGHGDGAQGSGSSSGHGNGAAGAPHGNGPHGDGPPGHAVPVDVPAVVEPRPVEVPPGKGPNGEGPPGHVETLVPDVVEAPGAVDGATGSAHRGRGPSGDGPPGHLAP